MMTEKFQSTSPAFAFVVALLLSTTTTLRSSPLPPSENSKCQAEYTQMIGELVASEGTDAVSTVWRLVFDKLDLNSNGRVGTAELVISLETSNILTSDETKQAYSLVEKLLSAGPRSEGVKDLDEKEFRDVIGSKLSSSSRAIEPPYTYMCKLITSEVRQVVTLLQKFTENVNEIKSKLREIVQESEVQERTLTNTWEGIFRSMDMDEDSHLSSSDLVQLQSEFEVDNEEMLDVDELKSCVSEVAKVFGVDGSEFQLTDQQFFAKIKAALYETDKFVADGVRTSGELRGLDLVTGALVAVVGELSRELEASRRCRSSYEDKLESILGADRGVAAPFVFALVDAVPRDGSVDFTEIDRAVVTTSSQPRDFSFARLMSRDDHGSFRLEEFARFLPDRVVDARAPTNDTELELSRLTIVEQRTWGDFCRFLLPIIEFFPPSPAALLPSSAATIGLDIEVPREEEHLAPADHETQTDVALVTDPSSIAADVVEPMTTGAESVTDRPEYVPDSSDVMAYSFEDAIENVTQPDTEITTEKPGEDATDEDTKDTDKYATTDATKVATENFIEGSTESTIVNNTKVATDDFGVNETVTEAVVTDESAQTFITEQNHPTTEEVLSITEEEVTSAPNDSVNDLTGATTEGSEDASEWESVTSRDQSVAVTTTAPNVKQLEDELASLVRHIITDMREPGSPGGGKSRSLEEEEMEEAESDAVELERIDPVGFGGGELDRELEELFRSERRRGGGDVEKDGGKTVSVEEEELLALLD